MARYFVNTGDGVEFHDSLVNAQQAAMDAIEGWRDCCDPDWPEEVEQVCYGEILGESKAVDCGENGEFVRYELEESESRWRCQVCGGLVQFDGTPPSRGA